MSELLQLDAAGRTDAGGREANEDSFDYRLVDGDAWAVLADGAGGHRGGAVASQLAVSTILDRATTGNSDEQDVPSVLESAVQQAQKTIAAKAAEEFELGRMRTTVIVACIQGGAAYWAHVGDSRLYLLRDHRVVVRTLDDSVTEMKRRMGDVDEDGMRTDEDRNRLLRSLGGEDEEIQVNVEREGYPLQQNDRLVLCSDGIWERFPRETLEQLSAEHPSSDAYAKALVEAAFVDGREGTDNATVVVVTVSSGGSRPSGVSIAEGTSASNSPTPKNRAAGVLLGLCLGEALGRSMLAAQPQLRSAYLESLTSDKHSNRHVAIGFGQYAAGAQLARELLLSWKERKRLDLADFATRIGRLWTARRLVGAGHTTWEAARRLGQGRAWREASGVAPAAGSGSARRAAVAALIADGSAADRRRIAVEQGLVTHMDPRCRAGCVAVAEAVDVASSVGSVSARDFCSLVADQTEKEDASFGKIIRSVPEWSSETPAAALAELRRRTLPGDFETDQPTTSYVVTTVAWGLYAFLRSPDSYLAVMETSIAVGGAVDAICAIAGAISGAHVGEGGLPHHLTTRLNDQGEFRCDELLALARATPLAEREASDSEEEHLPSSKARRASDIVRDSTRGDT